MALKFGPPAYRMPIERIPQPREDQMEPAADVRHRP